MWIRNRVVTNATLKAKLLCLTSALDGGEWSASRPGRFTSGTLSIGGWVDPRAGLDEVEKRKFLTLPGLELNTSVDQPVASRSTDYAVPARRSEKYLQNISDKRETRIFIPDNFFP
jgi:Rad3-related DNA helicase